MIITQMHPNDEPHTETGPLSSQTTELTHKLRTINGEVAATAEAFRDNNFIDLAGDIAARCGDVWRDFENSVSLPLSDSATWLHTALTNWLSERTALVEERNTTEAEARGELHDKLKTVCRKQVALELKTLPEPILTTLPAKPAFQAPILETDPSVEEMESRGLALLQRKNAVYATGNPDGHVQHKDPNTKFIIGAALTLLLGVGEALTGFDITAAVGTRGGGFGASLLITAGFNILSLITAISLARVLGYLSAKSTYNRLFPGGINPKTKTAVEAHPESPNHIIWTISITGVVLMMVFMYALAKNRTDIISHNKYLSGSEIAVWTVIAAIVIGFLAELMTSPLYEDRFAVKDRELTARLATAKASAKAAEQARNERNMAATQLAHYAHKTAIEEYEMVLAEAQSPLVTAFRTYRLTVEAAQRPLHELLADIQAGTEEYTQMLTAYHSARKIALEEYQQLVADLMSKVGGRDNRFQPSQFRTGNAADQITEMIEGEYVSMLDDPELDKLIKNFDPSVPTFDTLKEIDPLIQTFRAEARTQILEERAAAAQGRLRVPRIAPPRK